MYKEANIAFCDIYNRETTRKSLECKKSPKSIKKPQAGVRLDSKRNILDIKNTGVRNLTFWIRQRNRIRQPCILDHIWPRPRLEGNDCYCYRSC